MEFLFEIILEIVVGIADVIGSTMAETIEGSLTSSSNVKRVIISVLVGIVTSAVIISLGFGSVFLFIHQHPIAGFFVAITAFFFIVLFICFVIKLIKKDYKKK